MKPADSDHAQSQPQSPAVPTAAADGDPDAALVARMATGDEGALAELYDRWAGRLYAVALQILKAPDRAEDVLEETLWHAWRGAGSYSPARKSVATWLLSVARRKSLERLRARPRPPGRLPEVEYAAADPSFGDADRLAPGAEHAPMIEHTLRQLPDHERIPVELAYFHGLAQTEIAETLDQPLGTVRTNLRLGVQKLRRETEQVLSVRPRR